MTTKTLLLTLLWIVCCAGCTKATKEDVIGEYAVIYPYGTEQLTLANNGTYIQTIKIKGNDTVATNTGKWSYHEGNAEVILEKPLLADDNFGNLNKKYQEPVQGDWILEVRNLFGKVSLRWNDDQGFVFEKK